MGILSLWYMSIQIRPDAGEKRKTGEREKEIEKKRELKNHANKPVWQVTAQTREKRKERKKALCAQVNDGTIGRQPQFILGTQTRACRQIRILSN